MDKNKPQLLLEAFRTKAGSEYSQYPSSWLCLPRDTVGKAQKSGILFFYSVTMAFPLHLTCPFQSTSWCPPFFVHYYISMKRDTVLRRLLPLPWSKVRGEARFARRSHVFQTKQCTQKKNGDTQMPQKLACSFCLPVSDGLIKAMSSPDRACLLMPRDVQFALTLLVNAGCFVPVFRSPMRAFPLSLVGAD